MKTIAESLRLGSKIGTQYNIPFTIATPLIAMTKADIVHLAFDLNAPIDVTWSCYDSGDTPCGRCDACGLQTPARDLPMPVYPTNYAFVLKTVYLKY